jgi:polar amino acid transport system permease protein
VDLLWRFLPPLLEATLTTLRIAAPSAAVAVAAALLAGIAQTYGGPLLRTLARAYSEVFRGTSALILLFWIYYALPFFGVTFDATTAAILGLGLNVGAYGSEIVRSAILAVPTGQIEAAMALDLTRLQRLRLIVLPQAVLLMLPPMNNLMVELLKATALVSLITVTELTARAVQLNNVTYLTPQIFSMVLLIYFCMAMVITGVVRFIERHLRRKYGRTTIQT